MDPLFRPEVIQQSRRRLEGAILLATPLSTKFLSALFVSIVLVAGVFLCLGSYARKETAIGVITTQGGASATSPEAIADLYVSSRAAVFIQPGQSVNLMYQAFPYQKFGVGHGRIESVSSMPLPPGAAAMPGLNFKEPMFLSKVMLDKASVTAYGRDIPLQPGMLLSADIVIDRRSLIEWLLDPIYAVRKRIS